MATTIDWLINQTSMDGFKLLAGNTSNERIIRGINIMDNPDTIPWLKGGELILSTGYFLTSPKNYQNIVKELYTQGCAGLGIKMNRYIDSLPDEMIKQANSLGFPIIGIPYDSTMDQIANLIYRRIFEEEMDNTFMLASIYKELNENIFRIHSLKHILKSISKYINLPLILTDEDLNIIEYRIPKKSHFTLDSRISENGTKLFTNTEAIYFKKKASSDSAHLFEHTLDFEDTIYNFVIIPITNRNSLVGYLVCLNENSSLKKLHYDFFSNINNLLCIAMINNNVYTSGEENSLSSFYKNILTGKLTSKKEIESQCIQHSFNYSSPYICAVFRSNEYERMSMSKRRSIAQKMYFIVQQIASDSTARYDFISVGTDLILFYFLEKDTSNEQCILNQKKFYKEIVNQSTDLGILFYMGLSNICTGVSNIKNCYDKACSSIELGKKLHPDEYCFSYHEDNIYHFLTANFERERMLELYKEYLEPLDKFDLDNNSELVVTLFKYIESSCNMAKTAKDLFIHRNTMFYRLDQIKELLHIDLKNTDKLFLIQLAFYIKKLL